MRELRLIYANSATRVMTPAEVSKQAERIEAILYQLSEEGVEFKGRMRDHVAKACAVSKSKIARLHAIRNNLVPELLAYFDDNELNESEAYELQKLPKSAQDEIAASVKRTGNAHFINLDGCTHCSKYAEKFMKEAKCPNGDTCDHHEKRFVQALRSSYTWERCTGGCCLKCGHQAESCPHACAKVKAQQKVAAEKKKDERAAEKQQEEKRQEEKAARIRASRQAQAQRVLPLLKMAGLGEDAQLPSGYYYGTTPASLYFEQAAGNFDGGHWYDDHLIPTEGSKLAEMADMLNCSVDYLLGRTTNPEPAGSCPVSELNTAPTWQTGDPPAEGRYHCTVDLGSRLSEQKCDWKDGRWTAYGRPVDDVFTVIAWYPLPKDLYIPTGYYDTDDEDIWEEEDNAEIH
jgi:ParB family chromosome partitioning protein